MPSTMTGEKTLFGTVDTFLHGAAQRSRTPWGTAIARTMLEACEQVRWDVPDEPGGWMHHFQCPQHHDFLIYNPNTPHQHACRAGDTVTGAEVDAAWRVLRHRELADRAFDAALLGRLLSRADLIESAASVLLHYTQRYQRFAAAETAQPWMLKGRAFQQALTEALWLTSIARASLLVRDVVTPETWTVIQTDLLHPALQTVQNAQSELVLHQGNASSNFNAWLIAAITSSALALNDAHVLEPMLSGPLSLEQHLEASVLPDGFSWEGSPYYHNFVALAYAQTFELLECAGVNAFERWGEKLRAVWNVFPEVSWDNADLMQRRDGAYWRLGPLRGEYAQTLEVALARTGDSRFAELLRKLTPPETRPWTALAFGVQWPDAPPAPLQSKVYAQSGLAVLRNRVYTASLEFGAHGGAHGHFDKLSLHFSAHGFPWAHDPGSPPYGSGIHRAHHQTTAAHNTIVMDGANQLATSGRLLDASSELVAASTEGAYPETRIVRRIRLDEAYLMDQLEVDSDRDHTFDLLFHAQGEPSSPHILESVTEELLDTTGMYESIRVTGRAFVPTGSWQATFRSGIHLLELSGNSDQPLELLLCRSPNTDETPWTTRPLLILRTRSSRWRLETCFRATLIH